MFWHCISSEVYMAASPPLSALLLHTRTDTILSLVSSGIFGIIGVPSRPPSVCPHQEVGSVSNSSTALSATFMSVYLVESLSSIPPCLLEIVSGGMKVKHTLSHLKCRHFFLKLMSSLRLTDSLPLLSTLQYPLDTGKLMNIVVTTSNNISSCNLKNLNSRIYA